MTVLCLIVVGSRRSLMREHTFGPATNVLLALTLIFAMTMSRMSHSGLIATLRG